MTYRIGELAALAGVSADTVRYYERLGVLPAAPRGRNGYRRFPAQALQRLVVIQRALDAGFSLAELQRILRVRDNGGAPCRQVYAIAEQRLAHLEERIHELQSLHAELLSALRKWSAMLDVTPPSKQAGLLDAWANRTAKTRTEKQEIRRPAGVKQEIRRSGGIRGDSEIRRNHTGKNTT